MKQVLLLFLITYISSRSFAQDTKSNGSSKYNIAVPAKKWTLPAELDEISGVSWLDKDHLLVIEDIHPLLYVVKLAGDKAVIEKKITFAQRKSDKKFDIEDVTLVGNTVYALWSHGTIFKIDNWKSEPVVKRINTFLSKENNTEGACYDPATNSLLIACKNNSGDEEEKKSVKAIYRFDLLGDSLLHQPFLLLHKSAFKKMAGEKVKFFPSAIAVHPQSGDVYILSTKDTKALAVFSKNGELRSFQSIDAGKIPQPEGICFSPDGNLFITTEARHGQPAAVFMFAEMK